MESKINSASNQGGIFIQFLCYFYDGFLLLTLMLMFFSPTAAVPELRFPPSPFSCCFPLQHEIVCMPRAIKRSSNNNNNNEDEANFGLIANFVRLLLFLFFFLTLPNAVKAAWKSDFTHLSHRVGKNES